MGSQVVTQEGLETVLQNHAIVVVHFQAGWVPLCASFVPVFERLSDEHSDVFFGRVDVGVEVFDFHGKPANTAQVMFFRDGIRVWAGPEAQHEAKFREVMTTLRAMDMDALRRFMKP